MLYAVIEQQNPYAGYNDNEQEKWVQVQPGPLNRHQALMALNDAQRIRRKAKLVEWTTYLNLYDGR